MIDKKSCIRLQNWELCVRYSWSRSIVAAISTHASISQYIRYTVAHMIHQSGKLLPVSRPACNALYNSAAACSSLDMLGDFSRDSWVSVTSASELTWTVCFCDALATPRTRTGGQLTSRFSISLSRAR